MIKKESFLSIRTNIWCNEGYLLEGKSLFKKFIKTVDKKKFIKTYYIYFYKNAL